MRRRMQELAAGVFENEGPQLRLSSERLELEGCQQESLKGSFLIESMNEVPMRGIIYSDNPRMQLREPEFSGTKAVVEYKFNTDGLCEGDIQKGEFFIICNKNEYTLPFVVSTKQSTDVLLNISLDSLSHFSKLAEQNYDKAYEFFCTKGFFHCIKNESQQVKLMAKLLAYEGAPASNMEEFLVSTSQKNAVQIQCDFLGGTYKNVTKDIREMIEITKNGWGNVEIDIEVDAPFLILQNARYTREDFIGNSCRIPFYISAYNLHNGKNYGQITISSGFDKFTFGIEIENESGKALSDEYHMDKRITLWDLTRIYVDYRLGKLMPATFTSQTLVKIDHYLGMDPDNLMMLLYKAQVLLIGERKQEAEWILEQIKKEHLDKESQEYCYYLFVTTFLNKEKSYIKKISLKIQELYQMEPENPVFFWILLFIGEAYENSKIRKYNAIKAYCERYSHSPIFYVEAFALIKSRPDIMEYLGEFEQRVLYWAFKEEVLFKELADELGFLVKKSNSYHKKIMKILQFCYNEWPGDELLGAICSSLIYGNCYSKQEFPWFEQAVINELRINGLYEAYIMSATDRNMTEYPKMIQYYFQYKSNLPYKYQAIVYAGIINNRDKQTTLYLNCKPEMEQFAISQITAGHMDENLAVIYEMYLRGISITHELSRSLSPLLYIHKLYCNQKGIRNILVVHRQINKVQSYPVINGVAYFPIYSKEYMIAFEDDHQRRYVKSIDYDLIRLINVDSLTRKCLKVAPEQLPYLIYYFDSIKSNSENETEFSDVELGLLNILLASEAISEEYKQTIRPKLVQYYHQSKQIELLDEYLKNIELSRFSQSIRVQACELLIERGFYLKAYENIVAYGCHQLNAVLLVQLCTRMIERVEYEADDYLIGICTLLFKRGKYNEAVLNYLLKYMYGSTKSLYDLWIASRDYSLHAYELEERLLVQMLYSEKFVNHSEEILTSYIQNGGKKLVLDAYVSYFAYQYAVKESPANKLVMDQILGMLKAGQKLSFLLKYAILIYLNETSSKEYQIMRNIYEEFVLKGYVFAVFDQLPQEVVVNFPRYGKKVIEYRSNPKSTVYIRYLHLDYGQEDGNEEYITEQMEQMYEGIFVKEVTLFYGDTLQYYISERKEQQQNIVASDQISNREIGKAQGRGRFEQLNYMIIAEQLGETEGFKTRIDSYDEQLRIVKEEMKWIR